VIFACSPGGQKEFRNYRDMDGGLCSPYHSVRVARRTRYGGTMLDLVTHDAARPSLPAAHLEGHTTLTYGELAELVGEYQPEFLVTAPGFQRDSSQSTGEIYIDTASLLATSGSTGSPNTADRR
jgi:hypothetical protein